MPFNSEMQLVTPILLCISDTSNSLLNHSTSLKIQLFYMVGDFLQNSLHLHLPCCSIACMLELGSFRNIFPKHTQDLEAESGRQN